MACKKSAPDKKVVLVCTNFTIQSAFGLLILALNSARLGYETLIYFTFEGLNLIRKGYIQKLLYYPTGVHCSQEDLERYTRQLRETMDRKDIPYVEDMLEMAHFEGVQFFACKTSADLFDLTQDDFVDGVEIMLAKDFMKRAVGSELHFVF